MKVDTRNEDTQEQYQGAYNYQSQNQYQSYYSGEIDPQVLHMVRENLEYYEPKFRLMKLTNKKTSWNWAAFLVPVCWLCYRRMYLYAVLFWVGSVALGAASFILPFVTDILLGIFGNYIYMTFLEENLAGANNLQEPYRSQNINSHTGANPVAVWILIGVSFLLLLIIAFIVIFFVGFAALATDNVGYY